MKKFALFALYAICLLNIALFLLHAGFTPRSLQHLSSCQYGLIGLAGGGLVLIFFSVYTLIKKSMVQPRTAQEKAVLNQQANSDLIKETRIFIIALTGLSVSFCGAVFLAFNLSDDNFNQFILGLAVIFICVYILLIKNHLRNVRERLKSAVLAQENNEFKLRAVRSQLNPHFMFNALTSIQSLMNKNDTAAANHYLAIFADLTRRVLTTGEQDFISMEDELQVLDDYLQMEQLRFGFQYRIECNPDINAANTEIPAMLLQPFVENAVKHGVASLKQKGLIQINISKQGDDVLLSVRDNGPGFDIATAKNKVNSFGLKLSRERIGLLNEARPGQAVSLTIDSIASGTTVTIKLVNLLT